MYCGVVVGVYTSVLSDGCRWKGSESGSENGSEIETWRQLLRFAGPGEVERKGAWLTCWPWRSAWQTPSRSAGQGGSYRCGEAGCHYLNESGNGCRAWGCETGTENGRENGNVTVRNSPNGNGHDSSTSS